MCLLPRSLCAHPAHPRSLCVYILIVYICTSAQLVYVHPHSPTIRQADMTELISLRSIHITDCWLYGAVMARLLFERALAVDCRFC